MKICIVSHFSDDLDEGVRSIARTITRGLSARGESCIPIEINQIATWKRMAKEKPDIIHFIITPTVNGLLAQKIASILNPGAKVIVSAVHPTLQESKLVKLLRPDVVLTQSRKSKEYFDKLGCHTFFFPNGVDTTRFRKTDEETKTKNRTKYGVDQNDFLSLHLASLTAERNLNCLGDIEKKGASKALIIGRENENYDPIVFKRLKENVSYLWVKHFDAIEEIFQMSDCYIFPTLSPRACIETPLSVLEAMSCNLPIITTRFGALPDLFPERISGLFFIEDISEIENVIEEVKKLKIIDTRVAVQPYDWENLFPRLLSHYEA